MYLLACQSNFNLSINCMCCCVLFISEHLIGRPSPDRALFANVGQFVTTQLFADANCESEFQTSLIPVKHACRLTGTLEVRLRQVFQPAFQDFLFPFL